MSFIQPIAGVIASDPTVLSSRKTTLFERASADMRRQILDDCFRPADRRLTHAEAIANLRAATRTIAGVETVPIAEAGGRILRQPAFAISSVPAHTNSAVDGYAFSSSAYDRSDGTVMAVVGRAAAGHPLIDMVAAGSAARLFTGAVVPAGTDTIVMQEDVEVIAATADAPLRIRVPAGLETGANVRFAGEDIPAGARLFDPGHVLRPQDVAALASIGWATVEVSQRLQIAMVSSGDEIVRPGDNNGPAAPLRSGQVFDANAPMLQSLAVLSGAQVTDLGVLPDRADRVCETLAAAAVSHQVILTSGGASQGEEDHMGGALDLLGSRHFWQIAVKPGRPLMFGQIGDTVVIGLPGNPVAVLVCYLMYVHPLLRYLSGAPWAEPRRYLLPAGFSFSGRKTGRREFWRGILRDTPAGLVVDKFARDGSGLISGLRAADGLIDIPETAGDITEGDRVGFIPFTEFGIPG